MILVPLQGADVPLQFLRKQAYSAARNRWHVSHNHADVGLFPVVLYSPVFKEAIGWLPDVSGRPVLWYKCAAYDPIAERSTTIGCLQISAFRVWCVPHAALNELCRLLQIIVPGGKYTARIRTSTGTAPDERRCQRCGPVMVIRYEA